jgi:hypothetical protein
VIANISICSLFCTIAQCLQQITMQNPISHGDDSSGLCAKSECGCHEVKLQKLPAEVRQTTDQQLISELIIKKQFLASHVFEIFLIIIKSQWIQITERWLKSRVGSLKPLQ